MSVITRIEIQLGTVANGTDLKAVLDNSKIFLPVGSPLITPEIKSVEDLYRVYGDDHMRIRYFAFAQGSIPPHPDQQHRLVSYLQFFPNCGNSGSSACVAGRSNEVFLASTEGLNKNGGTLPTPRPVLEYTGLKGVLPIYIDCWNVTIEKPGIGHTSMLDKGGWRNVSVTLIYEITTDMLSYCAIGRNLTSNQGCYNYFSDTIAAGKGTEQMSRVMQEYCARNLPGRSLNDFLPGTTLDPKDVSVCACNMPASMYSTMRSSITGLDPRVAAFPTADVCLFGPCASSQFKPVSSGGCPLPQCLQIVNINNSNFVGEVNIDQSAECATYFPAPPPSPPSGTPPAVTPATPASSSLTPASSPPPSTEKSFFQKYGWYIVGVLIILMIAGILLVLLTSKKPKRRPAPRPLPPRY